MIKIGNIASGRDTSIRINDAIGEPKKSKKARQLLKEKKEALEVALAIETDAARKLKIQTDLDDTLRMLGI